MLSQDISPELQQLLLDGNSFYGIKALLHECDALSNKREPGRNNLLNTVACKLGSLVGSDNLDEDTVIAALERACRENGLTEDGMCKVRATIRSGLEAGKLNPRGSKDYGSTPIAPQPQGGLTLVKASSIAPERIDWLWEGVLAKNSISLLRAIPG